MRTPYNNGKIKMGIYHQSPRYVEQDGDMLTLQDCLIGDPKAIKRKRLARRVYFALLIVIAIAIALT